MWSGAGALPMSCPPPWGRQPPEIGDVEGVREGPHGSWPWPCPCSLLPYLRSRRRRGHTDTQGVLHFGARGDSPFGGRIGPHTGQISSKTTRIFLLMANLNPCRFGKAYTTRIMTRPPLTGVTTCNYIL